MAVNFISSDFRKQIKKIEKKQKLLLKLTKISFILGLIFLILSFAPSVWYSMTTKVDDFSTAILNTVLGKKENTGLNQPVEISNWQPTFNSRLSRETTIKIPNIGVDSSIHEMTYENYEDALKLGIWRIPDFGTPADRNRPMILAAHRFGYLAWTNIYRRKNSFFNLPKLKNEDLIEITYKQRKYIYKVYGESRGDEITDYSANLILYTCETLNSKIRIFKYARLLQI